jgi:5-methylcytosine-specific restriction endonuclease McrA
MIRGLSSLPHDAIREMIEHPHDCPHAESEIRLKTDPLGRPNYRRQCRLCGIAVGNRLSGKDLDTSKPYPAWNFEHEQETWTKFRHDRATAKGQHYMIEGDGFWDRYERHISSPEWAMIRSLVLERDQFLCQGCRQAPATEAHHLCYDHMGAELLFEVTSVCSACHDRIHPERRNKRPPSSTAPR